MKLPWLKKLSFLHGVLLSLAVSLPVASQIKPDATLPHNSLVTPKLGNVLQIDGGTRAGNNLFHSFTQFSVPTGGTAFFNNALDVSNLFSRVTGNTVSNIDGILKANGTASLFLLNPNGIIFGKNAKLNIGGSFVATTANAIQFGTLGIFSASTPNNSAVLTVNPSAFLFNQIAAQSINSQANLQVSTGNSLLLLGGNVSLDGSNGGQILAPGGRVELGGLAGLGTVGLNVNTNLSLTFPLGVPRADVSLNNGVRVNVRAGGGGSIAVNANNFNMLGGSKLRAGIAASSGSASSQGGDIDVDATGAITIDNGSFISNYILGTGNAGNISISTKSAITIDNGSFISDGVLGTGNGKGGDIYITTSSLSLTNGGYILAGTSGKGNAGNLTINASDFIKIDGISSIDGLSSGLFSQVNSGAVGTGGNIDITSKSLSLTNGGQILDSTSGKGNAGNLTINASDFINIDGFNSGLFSQVGSRAVGSGGNIDITSKSLSLTNGGQILDSTFGQGNAGNVTISASDFIKIDGVGFSLSGVFSTVESEAVGSGGNIDITSKSLSLTNGGQINASTYGQGNAGSVKITANDRINIDGSRVGSQVAPGVVGKGGNIDITSNSLSLTNGGQISASTFGQGNAGSVKITANDRINIDRSSVGSQVVPGAVGNGGNIDITSNSLSLTNDGQISASTGGQGNAGSVKITVNDRINIDGSSNGFLSGGVFSEVALGAVGNGGNIDITSNSLSLTNGGHINASTGGQGNAGSVKITANDRINIDGSSNEFLSGVFSEVALGAVGNGGNIDITSNSLSLTNGGQISADTFGQGNGGTIYIYPQQLTLSNGVLSVSSSGSGNAGNLSILQANAINLDGGFITAITASGEGGNITLQANSLQQRHNSSISATAGNNGNGGNLNITANTITALENSPITANANLGRGGNIKIIIQGLFNSPDSPITASSNAGINQQGTVNIQNLGFSVANSFANIINKFGSTEQAIAGSCIARRNVAQGSFTVTGTGGLRVTPDTDAYYWYAMPLIGASPNNGAKMQESIQPINSALTRGWKVGDPIVEAQTMIKLPDGRVMLGTIPSGVANANPQKIVCNPDNKQ